MERWNSPHQRRSWSVVVWCALAAAGCSDGTPARIDAPRDTLVVNTNQWTPLHVRVLNKRGQSIDRVRVSFESSAPSLIVAREDGMISCREDGSALVVARAGAQQISMPIRCWLVRRFDSPYATQLIVGGPPARLAIHGYDRDGRTIDPLRVQLVVDDSTVVRLKDGMVYGVKPGMASVHAQSFAQGGGAVFFVRARDSTSTSKQN